MWLGATAGQGHFLAEPFPLQQRGDRPFSLSDQHPTSQSTVPVLTSAWAGRAVCAVVTAGKALQADAPSYSKALEASVMFSCLK